MIADLHCHYPMHLLPEDAHPRGKAEGWWEHIKAELDAGAVAIIGHFANNPHWWEDWRVDLDGLVAGDAQLVCSVLYWPASEFRLGSVPEPGSFQYLKALLPFVEQEVDKKHAGTPHRFVKQASDLDQVQAGGVVLVHCVEGGFHLGPDRAAIAANVQWLADHGVLYITVAHLFFKGVATNAAALPPLTDSEYAFIFHQPGVGLTELGKALVTEMHRHKVLVDISHMSQEAIDATFELIEALDGTDGTNKEDYPVLATHVGMRSEDKGQAYNLTPETAKRIHDRGGLIGLIMAQHQLGKTVDAAASRATVRRHIQAMHDACRGFESCAIGSDIDGFIKPTLKGFEYARDFGTLADWVTADFRGDAPAILHDNALRVLKRVFAARDRARPAVPAPAGAPAAATPAADGFHHPASEAELIALVNTARTEGKQLRVRGAAHSVSHAIYTDPFDQIDYTVSWQTPPPGENLNVMLDRYRGFRVIDRANKLVEVEAGIHLGADPSDPKGTASVQASLLYQLSQQGWMLSNLGGITHQTISGFTATGSSGGSVIHSVNENLQAFRVIDAAGNVQDISRGDPQFDAMAPNLGVQGVVSTVTLKCETTYNIKGQEAITTIEGCAVDLFGPGSADKPCLADFLRDTEYARLLWWPQRGGERVEVWQAQRITAAPGFKPVPYEEFTAHPDVAEAAISILYTLFENLDDLPHAIPQMHVVFSRVEHFLDLVPEFQKLGVVGRVLAKFLSKGAELGADVAIEFLRPFAPIIRHEIPNIFPRLLAIFIQLDSEKSGAEKDQPQRFQDYAWCGLPMDNGADDELLRTAFTEIWVPLTCTQAAMELLKGYFDEPSDVREAYRRTGLNGWELYAAQPSDFWLSASHRDGDDGLWENGVFRIDPYWFAATPDDPLDFYEPLWELFRDSDVPFRLHWGKYQPASEAWSDYFADRYPRWADFLDLRDARDPSGTFFTSYWEERLRRRTP